MLARFVQVMKKLSLLGFDQSTLTDCSDVIPAPPPIPAANARSFFPPGQKQADIQQACATAAFPQVTVNPNASPVAPNMCVRMLHAAPDSLACAVCKTPALMAAVTTTALVASCRASACNHPDERVMCMVSERNS